MLIADYSLGDALLTIIWIFLFVAWIMVLFLIIGDLFRDHQLSGWAKAIWILFLIFIPFLTALIYLIARGPGMRDRSIKEQAEVRRHFDSYVRETAGTTPVDELHKLNDLKEKGAISDAEFERMKAKLVG
jgi:putative oligomerization/nucleic acid binding protein/phospholipase D-like protein